MSLNSNRRTFLKASAAAGVGFWAAGGVSARPSRSALEEIRFGCIGVGGKGSSDSSDANNPDRGRKVVAICDIDDNTLGGAKDKFPGAESFNDYRKMLEKMGDSIDAVTVSTPDHTHAPAALMAMRMGKHCFCQKPMTKSIYEARLMAETAAEHGLVTQMGNQGTAERTLRHSAALIRAGAIGDVKEVHVWTNRPVWPQGLDVPADEHEIPAHVHWDLWLGPAPDRAYHPIYHPFKWRGWWDFGTGALGDMACHTLNMSFMALNLANPVYVKAETSGHNRQTYPKWSIIEYGFPATEWRSDVKLYWYDGGKMPPADLLAGCPNADNGRPYTSAALVVGTEGNLYSPGDYGGDANNTGIIRDGEFEQQRRIRMPEVEYTRSPGHFEEFALAVKGEEKAVSNFPNYAGPLTETVLLGNLAVWVDGDQVDWNADMLSATIGGSAVGEDVQRIIKPEYRDGYTLES